MHRLPNASAPSSFGTVNALKRARALRVKEEVPVGYDPRSRPTCSAFKAEHNSGVAMFKVAELFPLLAFMMYTADMYKGRPPHPGIVTPNRAQSACYQQKTGGYTLLSASSTRDGPVGKSGKE